MLPDITPEEWSAAMDGAVIELFEEVGVLGPPIDALEIAKTLGIAIAMDGRQRGRARCVRLQGKPGRSPRPAILLRPEPRPERRQWAVAHELGEHVVHRVFSALSVDPREVAPTARETVATQLAGRILVPSAWFRGDAASCAWDLVELKSRYATASHELIARRMLEFPPPVIVTIFDHGRMYFRRSNVPGQVPPPSEAERSCWRAAHHDGRADAYRDGLEIVQAWPVHEPGWRREILRTEIQLELVA